MRKIESLELLFKAKCMEMSFISHAHARSKSETPSFFEKLSLRIFAQLKHIKESLDQEQILPVQLACLRTNLDAIQAFELKYPENTPYTPFKKMLTEFIQKYSEDLKLSKFYGGMKPGRLESDVVDKIRYQLLNEILDHLLFAERDDLGAFIVILTENTEPHYQNTYKIVNQLLMGECGGHFSPASETLVSHLLEPYFAELWRIFINTVKISPFGSEVHLHYDVLLYRYCRRLNSENNRLTTETVRALVALENEIVEGYPFTEADVDITKSPVKNISFKGPWERFNLALTTLNTALKQCPSVITQRLLKKELIEVASRWGFEGCVPYDAEQLAVIENEKILQAAAVSTVNSPYKSILNMLAVLVETESNWVRTLFVFLYSDTQADAAKISILENFYTALQRILHSLQEQLTHCIKRQANPRDQISILCDLFSLNEASTFDAYMAYSVVSAFFMDKLQGHKENLIRACAHLFKLLEAINKIKGIVPKGEEGAEDTAKIEKLHARILYFTDMADVMKAFVEQTPTKALNPDMQKKLENQPHLFKQRRQRMAFQEICTSWMPLWDKGQLQIAKVINEAAQPADLPPEEAKPQFN